jgi:hypothetical protein
MTVGVMLSRCEGHRIVGGVLNETVKVLAADDLQKGRAARSIQRGA